MAPAAEASELESAARSAARHDQLMSSPGVATPVPSPPSAAGFRQSVAAARGGATAAPISAALPRLLVVDRAAPATRRRLHQSGRAVLPAPPCWLLRVVGGGTTGAAARHGRAGGQRSAGKLPRVAKRPA